MDQIRIVYQDRRVIVAVKPAGVLSTDEPGGMPELLREALGETQGCVRTVHRLDRVTGGLMVFARSAEASRILSEQVRDRRFEKRYLAVVRGTLPEEGTWRDLLLRSREDRITRVVPEPVRGAQEAELLFRTLGIREGLSLAEITLHTGRTHQIRVQFSQRGFPLVGDRKYGIESETGDLALWSCHLGFFHPQTGAWMTFDQRPQATYPWTLFSEITGRLPE